MACAARCSCAVYLGSGGGKGDKFDLKTKAEALGVAVVLLTPGDDLEQLARDAIA